MGFATSRNDGYLIIGASREGTVSSWTFQGVRHPVVEFERPAISLG
jgi:hypothetical protein